MPEYVINLIYLPISFASGLWIPLRALPDLVKQVAPWLPPYHVAQHGHHRGVGIERRGVDERRVEVADGGSCHCVGDARVDIGGAGSHQCAYRRVERRNAHVLYSVVVEKVAAILPRM